MWPIEIIKAFTGTLPIQSRLLSDPSGTANRTRMSSSNMTVAKSKQKINKTTLFFFSCLSWWMYPCCLVFVNVYRLILTSLSVHTYQWIVRLYRMVSVSVGVYKMSDKTDHADHYHIHSVQVSEQAPVCRLLIYFVSSRIKVSPSFLKCNCRPTGFIHRILSRPWHVSTRSFLCPSCYLRSTALSKRNFVEWDYGRLQTKWYSHQQNPSLVLPNRHANYVTIKMGNVFQVTGNWTIGFRESIQTDEINPSGQTIQWSAELIWNYVRGKTTAFF